MEENSIYCVLFTVSFLSCRTCWVERWRRRVWWRCGRDSPLTSSVLVRTRSLPLWSSSSSTPSTTPTFSATNPVVWKAVSRSCFPLSPPSILTLPHSFSNTSDVYGCYLSCLSVVDVISSGAGWYRKCGVRLAGLIKLYLCDLFKWYSMSIQK